MRRMVEAGDEGRVERKSAWPARQGSATRLENLAGESTYESLCEYDIGIALAAVVVRNAVSSWEFFSSGCSAHVAGTRWAVPGKWHFNADVITGVTSLVIFANE